MKNTLKLSVVLVPLLVTMALVAQAPLPAGSRPFTPVTQKMLENPSQDDWLMFSRTYDAQRYSPLKQINKQNVGQLKMAFTLDMPAGSTETVEYIVDRHANIAITRGVQIDAGIDGNTNYKVEGSANEIIVRVA